MAEILPLALSLAERGWYVFPCNSDKTPRTKNGFHNSTNNPETVKRLNWAGGLIGIACEKSGFFALDVDRKNGIDGVRSLMDLIDLHGNNEILADWPLQTTPSGGYHFFFNLPDDVEIPNSTGKLGEGLDLRSRGYICTGPGYEWIDDPCPIDAPAWLLELIQNLKPEPKPWVLTHSPPAPDGSTGAYWLDKFLAEASPGNRNACGFDLACQLRDSGLSEAEANPIMAEYANRAPGEGYTEREAIASLDQAYKQPGREPARIPENDRPPEPEAPLDFDNSEIKESPATSFQRWSVSALLDAEFPEMRWAIKDVIPEGLTVLCGRPKVGKSWFCLQAAWAVGSGGMFLNRRVEKGQVLYVALEDSARRLKTRIRDMGIGRDALITCVNQWRPLHKGGLDDLLIEVESIPYRLLIIDTLTRSVPGVDQKNDGGIVGQIFDNLQRMAINRGFSIVLVDHSRKPTGITADPIDDLLHTTEKAAIADVILALYREQGKPGARLLGRGREIEPIEYSLNFHGQTRCWQLEGAIVTEQHEKILDALRTLGRSQVGEIARAIGENRGNTYTRLVKLADDDLVSREVIGRLVYWSIKEDDN